MNIEQLILIFSVLTIYSSFIKKIYKVKFSTPGKLNLGDVLSLFIITVISIILNNHFYYGALIIILTILWIDSLIMFCFGMKISLDNVKVFTQGVSTFKGEFKAVINLITRFHWMLAAYLFLISSLIYLDSGVNYFLIASIILLVFCLTKSKIKNIKSFLAWIVISILLMTLGKYVEESNVIYHALLIIFSLLSLDIIKFKRFLSLKSVFYGFLLGSSIKKGISTENNKHILDEILQSRMKESSTNKSEHFGKAKDFNVLLFTIESMSDEAFSDSPVARKITDSFTNRSEVQRFYSVSPNTNQSIMQLYTNEYGVNGTYNTLHELKKHGYDSLFISTQETKHFEMKTKLVDAGFDSIIDGEDLIDCTSSNDYRLLDNIDVISEKLKRGKAFIHVLNSQTHSRYSVENKDKFNRYKNTDDRGRYLNAVDEALDIVHTMLNKLKDDDVLKNTIVILTGDHGQSFGEEGYFTHSSATINQQVQIPLCIFNNDLPMTKADSANLLDLLPTVFDLLGVELDLNNKDGINFTNQERNYLLLYSETRGYNSPSNISVLRKGKKYYMDLLKYETRILDIDDGEISDYDLSKDEIRQIVFLAAEKHNILD
ncbi:sulfatase-like hydrolase/transferase [Veronia pacifica]|uniref:Sulfatase N-terminal domain-containing protein n=1 Tax=Veronia pacifica TaxID=1080227 RepID=A0A1C3EG42_9GAMM|nr:sulfatase-like hydrolase/transferase [Veronia pacifica]ODA32191.1 hypothetical protein A8L45_14115 [Veronia pacifica]